MMNSRRHSMVTGFPLLVTITLAGCTATPDLPPIHSPTAQSEERPAATPAVSYEPRMPFDCADLLPDSGFDTFGVALQPVVFERPALAMRNAAERQSALMSCAWDTEQLHFHVDVLGEGRDRTM